VRRFTLAVSIPSLSQVYLTFLPCPTIGHLEGTGHIPTRSVIYHALFPIQFRDTFITSFGTTLELLLRSLGDKIYSYL
jgi:hypothetical protein